MSDWTEERVETLKKLWADGYSASQIAMQLRGVTRNAVVGKVHRLGLPARPTTSRRKRHRPRLHSAVKPMAVRAAEQIDVDRQKVFELMLDTPEELVIPPAERKTIDKLEPHHCRWPIGDPRSPDFHFCGKHRVEGKSYCEHHVRRAYVTTRVAEPVSNEDWRRKPQRIMAGIQQVNFVREPA